MEEKDKKEELGIKDKLRELINTLQDALHDAELIDAGQKVARPKVRKALLLAKNGAHQLRQDISALG